MSDKGVAIQESSDVGAVNDRDSEPITRKDIEDPIQSSRGARDSKPVYEPEFLVIDSVWRGDKDSLSQGAKVSDADQDKADTAELKPEQKVTYDGLKKAMIEGDSNAFQKLVKSFSENPTELEPMINRLNNDFSPVGIGVSIGYSSEGTDDQYNVNPFSRGRALEAGKKDYGHVTIDFLNNSPYENRDKEGFALSYSTKSDEAPLTIFDKRALPERSSEPDIWPMLNELSPYQVMALLETQIKRRSR